MTHLFKPKSPIYKNHFAPLVIGALLVLYLLFSSTGCAENWVVQNAESDKFWEEQKGDALVPFQL